VIQIDARNSRELRAIVLSLAQADKTIRTHVRKTTRAAIIPEWKQGLAERAETRLEHRVLVGTAAATVTDTNIKLTSATKGKPLSGGLNPRNEWSAVEFGADRSKVRTYWSTSRNGNPYKVTRRTSAQLRDRRRQGRVVYPTANALIPRIAAMWAQTVARTFHEALEGKK
jgi:hypothetical protein